MSRMCSELMPTWTSCGRPLRHGLHLWPRRDLRRAQVGRQVQGRAVVMAIAAGFDGSRRFVGLDCVDTESRGRGARSWGAEPARRRGGEVRHERRPRRVVRAIAEVYPGGELAALHHPPRADVAAASAGGRQARVSVAVSAVFKRERDPGWSGDVRQGRSRRSARSRGAPASCSRIGRTRRRYRGSHSTGCAWRTNNVQERANRGDKAQTNAVQVFPRAAGEAGGRCADMNDEWAAGTCDAAGMAG